MSMFGSKNDKQSNVANPSVSNNVTNSIVDGTSIKGDINANNDIRIDGVLVGNLDCSGRVIIGAQGKVEGNITCANAIIEGNFKGKLSVKELLSVKETGVVNGEIITDKLMVQTGAIFSVTCTMGGQILVPLMKKESHASK